MTVGLFGFRKRCAGWLAGALLASLIGLGAFAAVPAWALSIQVSDVNGNPIGGGQPVDVNVLQQGIYLTTESGYADPSVSACETYWVRVVCNETGANVMTWNCTVVGGTRFWSFNNGAIVPGYTYTLTVDYMYQPRDAGAFGTDSWVLVEKQSAYLTAAGASGSEDGDDDADNEQDAPAQGSGGDSSDDGEADTDRDPASSDTTSPGQSSPDQSTISAQVPSPSDGTPAQSPSSQKNASQAQDVDANTSSGDAHESQGSEDALATLRSAAGASDDNGITATQLSRLGKVYGINSASDGMAEGDDDDDVNAALALNIVGLPYLWVLMWALIIGALPAGVAWRGGRFAYARRRSSRLC